MSALTPQERQVIQCINKLQAQDNKAAQHKAVASETGISVSRVGNIIDGLVRHGLISKKSRSPKHLYISRLDEKDKE